MWFWAHQVNKDSTDYVQSVKFLDDENIFITSTCSGEVKLWASFECVPLGTLNSNDWKYEKISSYVAKSVLNVDAMKRRKILKSKFKGSLEPKLTSGLKKLKRTRKMQQNGE
jgi:hypothetical protein